MGVGARERVMKPPMTWTNALLVIPSQPNYRICDLSKWQAVRLQQPSTLLDTTVEPKKILNLID